MPFHPVLIRFVLAVVTVALQACYQDSPPSTPPRTVGSLVMLLADQDWVIRRTAAEALGKIGDSSTVPHLLSALGDASPDVREAAARSLGRLGQLETEAGRRLAAVLMDPSPAVRKAAAQSLAATEIGPEVISGIAATMSNVNPESRSAAVSALLGLDVSGGGEELLRMAAGEDVQVRQTALAVLGDQNDGLGVPRLLDRLKHDVDAAVRAEAAYRLGFHADDTVRSVLEVAADQDASAQVRRWARQSLAGLTTSDGFDSTPRPIQSDPSGLAPQSR